MDRLIFWGEVGVEWDIRRALVGAVEALRKGECRLGVCERAERGGPGVCDRADKGTPGV